jgi:hypothetical protein
VPAVTQTERPAPPPKPPSVRKFDYLYLGSILMGLVVFALTYETALATARAGLDGTGAQIGPGLLIGGLAFGIVINLALWFLVSGLRLGFVRWILGLFVAWGLFQVVLGFVREGVEPVQLAGLAPLAMSIAAIAFLFRRDASSWFSQPR